MFQKNPPRPTHVPGTHKGEETVRKKGKEPGRFENGARGYRTARDSTSLNPEARDPIDPRMPCIPPA
jgi:hypothetical protein